MRNKKLIVLLTVVTVLIVVVVTCGATFLVRNVYAYSYYGNAEGGAVNYDARIIEAADIRKNSSMFFLDEQAVSDRIEKAFPNVRVVNIERRFPDSVSINYVVYENSFQYENGGSYYQCYASGRIGGVSATKMSGYFTVKPRGATSDVVGEFFQSRDGYDRKIMDAFISFMYSKGLNDSQINERIDFIDLTRDGYVYVRTKAGCSIELKCGADDFAKLMDRGWSLFVDPNPDSAVTTRISGLIKVWTSYASDSPTVKSSYIALGAEIGVNADGGKKYYSDASYYLENYGGIAV